MPLARTKLLEFAQALREKIDLVRRIARLEYLLYGAFLLLFLAQLIIDFFFLPPTSEKLQFPGRSYFLSSLFFFVASYLYLRRRFRNSFDDNSAQKDRTFGGGFVGATFVCFWPLIGVVFITFVVQCAYIYTFGYLGDGRCVSVLGHVSQGCSLGQEVLRSAKLTLLQLPVFVVLASVAYLLELTRLVFSIFLPKK
ncbi:MAG: hypothetical protein KDD64_07110 [Bdellovibrionales bacterium]|nr:hypothetical protein [Bdellovibrionales bacterium]